MTRTVQRIKISPVILPALRAPLIIGIQTLGKHGLLAKQLPSLCTHSTKKRRTEAPSSPEEPLTREDTVDGTTAGLKSAEVRHRTPAVPHDRYKRTGGSRRELRGSSEVCELCVLQTGSRDFFGIGEDSEDEEIERHPINIVDLLPSHANGGEGAASDIGSYELIDKIQLEGSEKMQTGVRNLCERFYTRFAESVVEQAAHVPPMTLEIDADKLRQAGRGRKAAPRPQSLEKLAELKKMIEELLRLGVIRVSTSEVTSQVLLVAKKGTSKLRFCIDYRAINEATLSPETWPIPNIKSMLERLGAKKPQFFGVMDLTSGYHQAPLSESAKKWTAFVTAFGQFEWNRVAMGLTGAPSYFQRVMMTTVLGDILTKCVEVYLDDFIVFGATEDEFLANLEAVLLRCEKAGITLNPSKCRFGMSCVEYVGHTIDKDGLHFSREKLDSVLDMPKPQTKGDMKIFLGMVNYFHSHIRELSSMEAPLTAMVGESYTKGKRRHGMHWTPEGEIAFEKIKVAIDNCPKLFFRDEDLGPVYVQTDASEFGIGGYMFQMDKDGVTHRPIEFFSKTLSGPQRRWGIPDKEAYAIFYAFKKWEHHLRDREFVLQTDHKNLAYVNYEGTAKVKRWKMLIQEFRFKIEYLPGEENVVADGMSRCCSKISTDKEPTKVDMEFLAFLEDPDVELTPDISSEAIADLLATVMTEEDECNFLEYFEEASELFPITSEEVPIPDAIRSAIAAVHSGSVGHVGCLRCERRLRQNGTVMKKMRWWVTRFIHECPFCQKMRYRKTTATVEPYTAAQMQSVMQRLSLDFIGPVEEDELGYKYILTVIDNFSRWVMAYPCKTMETLELVRNLIFHIGIFGRPVEFLTDNGSNLTSDLMGEICEMLRVDHKTTVAYSHQENSIIERSNLEVVRYLRALVFDANSVERWSMVLPFAQRICNAEVCKSIGLAPAQIIFGGAINLDRGVLIDNVDTTSHVASAHGNMSEYVVNLVEAQRHAMEYARAIQEEADRKHMMSSGEDITEFEIGSFVTVSYPENQSGVRKPPAKLMTHRKGPFLVLSHEGPAYRIKSLTDQKVTVVHISRLELFRYDVANVDPVAIAATDKREFIVEAVREHVPIHQPAKNKPTLQFLVKWKGYPESENEWVPWQDLTNNIHCLRYCYQTVGMRSICPMAYRDEVLALIAEDEERARLGV